MNTVDLKKPVKILEGQIDSLFIENSIASCDSNLVNTAKELGSDVDKVLIFDNQPRNKEVVNLVQVAINKGFKVVIWPSNIEEKDVNAMVMSGMSKKAVEEIIEKNTCSGVEAQLKFVYWKKV